ncbi:armadillo repeat-containing protein 2-like [Rhopilema esculentum]|uniref:armadillo repeat-containing protein 2-like n=1 Tax=Rhopilema esculentum TaxID=499914 RepID=UPI0031E082C2
MQPTPPKSRKPQYRRPFYDAGKKTSAEIVSEARNSMKPLETSRPFTPLDTSRRLFGNQSRPAEGRPPSAFSIGAKAFSETGSRSGSRPPTGKLSPLKKIPDVGAYPDSSQNYLEGSVTAGQSSEISSDHQEKPKYSKRRSSNGTECFDRTGFENHDTAVVGENQQFPPPPKSMEPSVTKTGRPSSRQRFVGRRVQSGPKEHSNQRSLETSQELRKSNSFDSFARDVKSADSGVVSDATGQSDRLHSEVSGTRSLSSNDITPGNQSIKRASIDSVLNVQNSIYNDKEERNIKDNNSARPLSSSSEADTDNQAVFFKENVEPLLKQMELNYLHTDMEALSINFDVLWKSLQLCGMLSKVSGSGAARRRTAVLRTIFKFVEADSAEVILKLCKLALMMKVTGNNLTNICKLIFKISKDKTKDTLFKEHDLLRHMTEIIRNADINLLCDGIIYASGSLKFLAANSILHEELLEADCVQCFVDLLNKIKQLTSTESQALHLSHILVQASAAIRNIADIPNIRASFLNSGLIRVLLDLLQTYWKDPDYMLNVSRILSKLTQYSDCCHLVCESPDSLQLFLKAISHFINEQDVVVRLVFVLGNVAAKDTDARTDLHFKYNCLDVLVQLLSKYVTALRQDCNRKDGGSKSDNDAETDSEKSIEILVKTVRVIANMSIDSEVAADVIENETFLDIIQNILEIKSEGPVIEELFINTAGMLNNLSFYSSDDSAFSRRTKNLTEALINLLFIDNMDCIIEATRVFGNLTRCRDIRNVLRERKVVQMLITLLESADREVVFCSCGVLINLMVDNESRQIFQENKGVRKLVDALKDFGQTDWQLSCMICQTLWNYSEKITSAVSCFGEEETEDLIQTLQDYTDPEVAFDYSNNPHIDSEAVDLMMQIWNEQFEQVGIRLLSRIEDNHTNLRPLVEEPD